MSTLRLLLWLRWRIALNTTNAGSRWASAGLTLLFALAFSPLYVGGALGALALTRASGPTGLPVVFGLCHITIVWVSLLTGAMGRLFELDKLKRYPLQPLTVFGINVVASLSEPVVLMTLPSLVLSCIGVSQHSGLLAGATAAVGAAVLLLLTASLLQLLLALLDDLLRREWMRYVAALFFTLTLVSFQVIMSRKAATFAHDAKRGGMTGEQLLEQARVLFAQLPTVSAPASLAGAHPPGWPEAPWLALLVCAALIVLPVLYGARVMGRAVLRPAAGGGARRRGRERPAFVVPGLGVLRSRLLAREFTYLLRTPAILYQMLVVPLTVLGISFLNRGTTQSATFLPGFIMAGTLAGRNLMLWGYDGPGVRTLLLLPLRARDLVLTKNLSWLASTLLEAGVVGVLLAVLHPAEFVPELPLYATGYLAIVFVAAVLGTSLSLSRPTRPPQQGMARRSPGGALGLGAFLGMLASAALVVVGVLAVRALTPDAWDGVASLAVTTLFLAAAVAVWWISLDRHADLLERQKEKLVDALAKSADA